MKPSKPVVLVTRPSGDAAVNLCELLEQAGYVTHSLPLLELQPLPPPTADEMQLLSTFSDVQHAIFISSNAVRFGRRRLGDHWAELVSSAQCYGVGAITAAALQAQGVNAVAPAEMRSEGLLALPALADIGGQRVLIIKGEGGRNTLAHNLRGRGAVVEQLACYRRICPALAAGELARRVAAWGVAIILISSGEGLANLQLLLSPPETTKFKELHLIVPSQRVAELALAAGFRAVSVAENASDAAMLQALNDWHAAVEK